MVPQYGWTAFCLAIPQWTWGCFHLLAAVNDAALNVLCAIIFLSPCLQFLWVYTHEWDLWIVR